ncbi:MAG: hypothetical protein LC633_01435 [Desulfobulbaceae bacterium]|nr:hypothetical protein [Desulfobulbaceae bacterium]
MSGKSGEDPLLRKAIIMGAAAFGATLVFRAVRLVAAALMLGGGGGKKKNSPPAD